MGFHELTYRSRQEASKWLGRIGVNGHSNGGPEAIFEKMVPDVALSEIRGYVRERDFAAAERTLISHFREAGPARFFAGALSEQVPAMLKEKMASACAEVVDAADRVSQGRFDLLGYHGLYFGDPVDWRLDPISGQRSPLVHWSRLDPLDPKIVGDSKVVWELNRHQWMLSLGQAYQLTGERRYAELFARYIEEWIRANPPGVGINWASSLELALRLISWCWALLLFRDSATLSPELFASMLEEISLHAEHIEKNLSYYFAPNTHLTGEALGLFYAGILFPELRQAHRWRELGARILIEQSERQILADGVYFEQATCYQRYTAEIYLHYLILARRNDWKVPASLEERIAKLLDFLLAARRPDGSLPEIGDADGGWLLPVIPREPWDLRGLFSTAAVFYRRPDYAWAAGGLAPETLWLLGSAAAKVFAGIEPSPPATAPSRLFPDGGYAVMRNSWEGDAHHLIFDAGPLAGPLCSGHGHADLLSIQCAVFGAPFVVDPGTYGYTAEPEWRDFFRSAAAHSTATVDNAQQAVPASPFKWKTLPRAHLRKWVCTDLYDFADAAHDAYRRLPDPVRHRRRVLFVKPRYWLVVDDFEGTAEHRVEIRFQFAPLEVAVGQDSWVTARGSAGHGLWIKPFTLAPLETALVQGAREPMQGWFSPDYGQLQQAPALVYSTVTRLPLRVVTLLVPTEDASAAPPEVSMLVGDDLAPTGLVFAGKESVVFTEEEILID